MDGEGFTLTQPAGMGAPPPYGAPPGNISFIAKNYFLDPLQVFSKGTFFRSIASSKINLQHVKIIYIN